MNAETTDEARPPGYEQKKRKGRNDGSHCCNPPPLSPPPLRPPRQPHFRQPGAIEQDKTASAVPDRVRPALIPVSCNKFSWQAITEAKDSKAPRDPPSHQPSAVHQKPSLTGVCPFHIPRSRATGMPRGALTAPPQARPSLPPKRQMCKCNDNHHRLSSWQFQGLRDDRGRLCGQHCRLRVEPC